MKKVTILILLTLPLIAIGQNIISNNNTSILLLPEGIELQTDSNYASSNIGLGFGALKNNIGVFNTAYGSGALLANHNGGNNVAIGSSTLTSNSSGVDNVAVGLNSQAFNEGSKNTSIGANSQLAIAAVTEVTAAGFESLKNNQHSALTAFGAYSLKNNVGGENNSAFGYESLMTGSAIDFANNTAFGYRSLKHNDSYNNTAVGSRALENANRGMSNIALGKDAMSLYDYGHYNIAIGNNSLSSVTADINGCIAIGHSAGQLNSRNNMLYIENTDLLPDYREQPLIGGKFAASGSSEEVDRVVGINRKITDLLSRSEVFQVEGEAYKTVGGGNWITTSDRRLKKDIENLNSEAALQKIISLQGVKYHWKDATKGKGIQLGFIAQDLQKVFPSKVYKDKEGYLSASYGDFDPMLVEAIKALYSDLNDLKTELAVVKKELAISTSKTAKR